MFLFRPYLTTHTLSTVLPSSTDTEHPLIQSTSLPLSILLSFLCISLFFKSTLPHNCQSSLIMLRVLVVSLSVILAATISSSSTVTAASDFEENHFGRNRIVNLDQQQQQQQQQQQRPLDNLEGNNDNDFDYSTKIIMDFEKWVSIHKPQGYEYYSDIDIDIDIDPATANGGTNNKEYQKRKSIYNENIKRWNALNQLNSSSGGGGGSGAKYGPENEKYADLTPTEFVKVVGCSANNNYNSNDDGNQRIEIESKTITNTGGSSSGSTNYYLQAQKQHQQQKRESFLRSRQLMSDTPSKLNSNTNPNGSPGHNSNSTKSNSNNNNTAISSSPTTIMYIDWRNNNGRSYVTPPKNQGPHGTCWSFSAAENLEGLQVRQGYTLQNISEQEFISCCPHCRGRATSYTFDWLLNTTNGYPALEEYYPYNGNTSIACRAKDAPRAKVQLHSWNRVHDDDGTGDNILDALDRFGPMGLGVDATCFHGYKSGIIRNCTTITSSTSTPATTTTTIDSSIGGNSNKVGRGINHAVLMVAAGTDMNLNKIGNSNKNEKHSNNNDEDEDDADTSPLIPTFVDFFTIKNSWGNKWGEGGYVRIERGKDFGWGNLNLIYTE